MAIGGGTGYSAASGVGQGTQGESYRGVGAGSTAANGGGGGGGYTNGCAAANGGSGGHATAGSTGGGGLGGGSYVVGAAGASYGAANLSTMFFGSGGGGGSHTCSGGAGAGGKGGGIVLITGNSLSVTGSIAANGQGGTVANGDSAGGSGSGGSVLLSVSSATLGTGLTTATGGTDGNGSWGPDGAAGRIALSNAQSGTTNPTYTSISQFFGVGSGYLSPGTIVSTNLLNGISSVKSIDSFAYNLTSLPANTTASVQFSQNSVDWYNSSGVSGGTNSLSAGVNSISLSGLAWSTSLFYYKITYTTDGSATPSLDYITVNYTTSTSTIGTTWAACIPQTGGDFTLSTNCYFPNTRFSPVETNVDGVDRGDITVSTYKTLTIRGDQQIARNDKGTNNGKGVLTIQDGASIAISDIPIGGKGGNVRDYSGNNNEGTPGTAVATTVVAGKYGTARSFNGTSDYISAGTLNNGSAIKTVEFWVNPSSTTTEFIDLNGTNYISVSGGTISATGFTTIYVNSSVSSTLTSGQWQHVAVTADTGINASAVNIGKRGSNYFSGTMDDVRIYNYALSQAQITDDMNYGSVNKTTPVAWYRFEDGGQIKETNLWVKDEDGDGWAQSYDTQQRAQNDTPGTGWVRRYLTIGSAFGDARDGNITFTTNTNLNTWNHSGRTCADGGDAVTYSVSSLGSTTLPNTNPVSTATLTGSVSTGCIYAGDNVLVINQQGTTTNTTNVGNYELLKVYSVSGNTITFTSAKKKYYGNGATDDTNLGTATTNQRVMLQRVPQYGNVTVNTGVTVNANAWDGTKGGVVAFVAKDTVTVTGTIQSSASGYRGSTVATGGGEAFCNANGGGATNNGGAGGAGGQYAGCEGGHPTGYDGAAGGAGGSAVCGGGGGASAGGAGGGAGEGPCSGYTTQDQCATQCLPGGAGGAAGSAGAGTAALGGGGGNGGNGGGGGGFGDLASVFNNPYTASTGGGAGQGGGGGYGTLGTGGSGGSVGTTGAGCQSGGCGCAAQGAAGASGGAGANGGAGVSGNGGTAGAGGVGGGTYAYCAGAGQGGGGAGGGGGGGTYGTANLSKMYFGSGGGKGGGTGSNGGYDNGTNGAPGGAGGTGGGTNGGTGGGIILIHAKTLTATGAITATGAAPGGNGGGGAGGAIKILGDTLTLGSNLITALGGGNGGSGRVAIGGVTVTGTANPTFTAISAP